jgi:light-regulated signal transduction histidine kinase (bacteriophytochrome)
MNRFICDTLADDFQTATAFDGKIGAKKALELLPDLVLSDVMMPALSGDELVRELRTHAELDRVPIILLTAKADDELRVRLLKEGAQDYVTKPFSAEELKARVSNLSTLKRAQDVLLEAKLQAESANQELEAFSYSVAHDLRAPLRGMSGFSQALIEDYAEKLDPTCQDYLQRIRSSAQRMALLIDGLLQLSKLSRADLRRDLVDLSRLAGHVAEELHTADPERSVEIRIEPGMTARGDAQLLRLVLQNLMGNAWKFTQRADSPLIQVGIARSDGASRFYVRDNGVGFDMQYANKLFVPFQRLHAPEDYPGTGIGLATVQRIVSRHGGKVSVESKPGEGSTFCFTLATSHAKDVE